MHTVMVSSPGADMGAVMSAMRLWLDRHHVQPSAFRYEAVGAGRLLLKLEFAAGDEAKDFALEFAAPQRRASNVERRLRHTVATIRCSLPIPRKAGVNLPWQGDALSV